MARAYNCLFTQVNLVKACYCSHMIWVCKRFTQDDSLCSAAACTNHLHHYLFIELNYLSVNCITAHLCVLATPCVFNFSSILEMRKEFGPVTMYQIRIAIKMCTTVIAGKFCCGCYSLFSLWKSSYHLGKVAEQYTECTRLRNRKN